MFQGVGTLHGPVVPQGPHFSTAPFKLFSKDDTYRMLVQSLIVPTEAHKLGVDKARVADLELFFLLPSLLESFEALKLQLETSLQTKLLLTHRHHHQQYSHLMSSYYTPNTVLGVCDGF